MNWFNYLPGSTILLNVFLSIFKFPINEFHDIPWTSRHIYIQIMCITSIVLKTKQKNRNMVFSAVLGHILDKHLSELAFL